MSNISEAYLPAPWETELQDFSISTYNPELSTSFTPIPTELNSSNQRSTLEAALILLVTVPLALFTVCANLMVWISFYLEKPLQTVSNYFILSLASADVIIGLISMPLFTIYLLQGWRFGPVLCDIWLCIDYGASNASVMNLCIICFDRYLSITRPLTYRAKRTPRKAKIMIALAWTVSVALWMPLIIGWQFFRGRNVPENECYIQFIWDELSLNALTIAIAFYIPVLIMCILYYKIWRETEKRARDVKKLQEGNSSYQGRLVYTHEDSIDMSTVKTRNDWRRCPCMISDDTEEEIENSSDLIRPQLPTNSSTRDANKNVLASLVSPHTPPSSPSASPRLHNGAATMLNETSPDKSFAASLYTILIKLPDDNDDNSDCSSVRLPKITMLEDRPCLGRTWSREQGQTVVDQPRSLTLPCQSGRQQPICKNPRVSRTGSATSVNKSPTNSRSTLSISTVSMVNRMAQKAKVNAVRKRKYAVIREKKAARTLCAILLAFIVTWTPYSVLILLVVVFTDISTEESIKALFNVGYWMCYLNSTINPICYALCNQSFRKAFRRILTCQFKRKRFMAHDASMKSYRTTSTKFGSGKYAGPNMYDRK